MVFKVFLDINILIDLLDSSRSNHQDAIKLIREAEDGNIQTYVTESVLNTTAYLIRKDYSPKQIVQMFNHFLSFGKLIPIDEATYLSGLQYAINDIEDAILYSAALHKKVDYFITNDIKDLKKNSIASLPVLQSKELLQLL